MVLSVYAQPNRDRPGAQRVSRNYRLNTRHFLAWANHFRSASPIAYTRSLIVACSREKREEVLSSELHRQLLHTQLPTPQW